MPEVDETKLEYGNVVWYLDPVTRDVPYGIDGEDNHDYYSYSCIKNAASLGHPEHLNHYDIWFTKNFQLPQIKGFIKLSRDYKDTFDLQDIEIQQKFEQWMNKVLAGRISSDNKDLLCYCVDDHKLDEFRTVVNCFLRAGLIKNDTNVYSNGQSMGKVSDVMTPRTIILANKVEGQTELPNTEVKIEAPLPKEDPEILKWIEDFKNGSQEAGEKLYTKYEGTIHKIWVDRVKKMGLSLSSPEAEDALSEAFVAFLKTLKSYNANRGVLLNTYLYKVLDGIVKNYFNFGRYKERTKEVSMPTNTERSEGDVEKGLDTFKAPDKSQENQEIKSITDAVNDVLEDSGDKERLKYIFDEFFISKKTLQDIGDELGITKERVRQLLNAVVQEIRNKVDPKMLGEKVKLGMIFNDETAALSINK